MAFELFDPAAEVRVTVHQLPHWYQPGVTYFVTFRTDDSVPVEVMTLWRRRQRKWLQSQGVDMLLPGWRVEFRKLPTPTQNRFHAEFSRQFLDYLDQGHGECVLKRHEIQQLVSDSLRHFDGQRYEMGDFVVMPNHVHLLVCLHGDADIEEQCESWKRFTATKINRLLNRQGRFWQEESFDHLVRSPEQFDYLRRYIAANPAEAGLRAGEFLLYRPG